MASTLNEEGMDLLFRKARTHNAWLDRPVSDATLRQLYELMKWGPTSANSSPARVLFLRTAQAKARLLPALSPGNVEKTRAAPVTAIIAYDLRFYERLPRLFPHNPNMRQDRKAHTSCEHLCPLLCPRWHISWKLPCVPAHG